MPPADTDSAIEDVSNDRLRGVLAIAKFLNEGERCTAYLVEKKIIPTGREGTSVIASKARLRGRLTLPPQGKRARPPGEKGGPFTRHPPGDGRAWSNVR